MANDTAQGRATNHNESLNLERWLKKATEDQDLIAELQQLSQNPTPEQLQERFGSQLVFGTGGLRGLLGAGTNRINIYTVRRATQGLAEYLKETADCRPVAIAYDSRIKSDLFARETARVLAGNGIAVWLYPSLMPTPSLSFAVRKLQCSAGVVITASHNPAEYNGYKVYGSDGCQITPKMAKRIYTKMQQLDWFEGIQLADFDEAVQNRLIQYISEDTVDGYIQAVKAQSVEPSDTKTTPLHIVYTPLNGAGRECVTRVLGEMGAKVTLVPEQTEPDGRFPTCPYPNPEEAAALELGLALCREQQPDLMIATDPDCDRLGAVVRHDGDYVRLTGNEIGVLLFDYICKQRKEQGTMPADPVAVKTVVTTDMAQKIAQKYGVELRETLTGFKFIGEQIGLLEQQGQSQRFIFGFEESCGYLAGDYVRDKDGVVGAMLVCEMARYYKAKNKTLYQVLQELYQEYGYYTNTLLSFSYPGVGGTTRRTQLMQSLYTTPPGALAGEKVVRVVDYRAGLQLDNGQKLIPADMLLLQTDEGSKVYIRPSGTEPKMKAYVFTVGQTKEQSESKNAFICAAVQDLIGA